MLAVLLNLFVRSALILLAAELLLRWFLRRTNPQGRYRVLLASFVLLLVWPILAGLLPQVTVPLWRMSGDGASVTVTHIVRSAGLGAPVRVGIPWPLTLWTLGAAITFLPVLIGQIRLITLSRRAMELKSEEWTALMQELCFTLGLPRVPRVFAARNPVMPMTFGWLRAKVILPAECLVWSEQRRRIVLAHELAHIARHDVAARLFARLVAALWWFQPLTWMALRSLRRESERACDRSVVVAGVRPSDYAAELLEIARCFRTAPSCPAAAIGMARPGDLERRLFDILEARPIEQRPGRLILTVAVLSLLTLSAWAIQLVPDSQPTRGDSPMKKTVLAGLMTSAGLSAASLGGLLYDPSGAVVPNAKASLYNPDTNTKVETTTSPDGHFAFDALPAGQYVLRVQKPGFATLLREFNLKSDTKVDKGLTLNMGSMQESVRVAAAGIAAPPAVSETAKPIRIGGEVMQAKLIHKVNPLYPAAAKAAGIQGTVTMDMVISKEGEPLDIRVDSSPNDDLSQSALEAVRQWRYASTLLNGEPIEVVTTVIVNYTLMP